MTSNVEDRGYKGILWKFTLFIFSEEMLLSLHTTGVLRVKDVMAVCTTSSG
jgi:hypothetical protein